MKDLLFTSEINPPSAQEISLHVRKMERAQARFAAEFAADGPAGIKAEKRRKRSLRDVIMTILMVFGVPR